MPINEVDETNSVLLDEERRLASHQQVKASIDNDVNTRIQRESSRVEPNDSVEMARVAQELKQKSVRQAVQTERELERGRVAARITQVIDYVFYIIYGLIALEFLLRLMAARPGSGFVQFLAALTRPILGPFYGILAAPSIRGYHIELSYLLALIVYILIHLAINGAFRMIVHRKVAV